MNSLPWADHDNYSIDFEEQTVKVRVADMSRFDEQQLIESFTSRELTPMWLDEISPLSAVDYLAADQSVAADCQALEGDWQTDETANRKLCLRIQRGLIRLHTTKLGYWTSSTFPIKAVEPESLTCVTRETTFSIRFHREDDRLTVVMSAPSDYAGEFTLFRELADETATNN